MPTDIARDPFARETLVRITEFAPKPSGCDWCGDVKKTRLGKPFLFRYGVERDARPKPVWQEREFCCVECMRLFYGA